MDKYVCNAKVKRFDTGRLQIGSSRGELGYYLILCIFDSPDSFATNEIVVRVSKNTYDKVDLGERVCLPIAMYRGCDDNYLLVDKYERRQDV